MLPMTLGLKHLCEPFLPIFRSRARAQGSWQVLQQRRTLVPSSWVPAKSPTAGTTMKPFHWTPGMPPKPVCAQQSIVDEHELSRANVSKRHGSNGAAVRGDPLQPTAPRQRSGSKNATYAGGDSLTEGRRHAMC